MNRWLAGPGEGKTPGPDVPANAGRALERQRGVRGSSDQPGNRPSVFVYDNGKRITNPRAAFPTACVAAGVPAAAATSGGRRSNRNAPAYRGARP